ncbi:MAG: DegT/DnrJ/EryC1/StrS family aminotransferase [Magnetococcales bacterium]|nr:DegT/DnrJ/EryC1/StrS family aminotransferase [Magnetococcales bacterium]
MSDEKPQKPDAQAQSTNTILLHHPEITESDEAVVQAVLETTPFADGSSHLERHFSQLFNTSAIAFSSASAAVIALKQAYGWPSGASIALSPLSHPLWHEALASAWLTPCWQDINPLTLSTNLSPATTQDSVVTMVTAPSPVTDFSPTIWEDLSLIGHPTTQDSKADFITLLFSESGPIHGQGVVILSENTSLIQKLTQHRQTTVSLAAATLAIAQQKGVPLRQQHHQKQASHYQQTLYERGLFKKTPLALFESGLHPYIIVLNSETDRDTLKEFLNRARILVDGPIWYRVSECDHLAGFDTLKKRALALPLHTGITPPHQKRIINRINRWSQRYVSQLNRTNLEKSSV